MKLWQQITRLSLETGNLPTATNDQPAGNTVWPKKPDHFLNCITLLYNDIGRQSIYQNVQLFIRSKSDILNAAAYKYSLHKVRETILH